MEDRVIAAKIVLTFSKITAGRRSRKDFGSFIHVTNKPTLKLLKVRKEASDLIIDTTYFGRSFGVMVFRCALRKKNLFWKFINHETTDAYVSGIEYLRQQGWNILAIVADGRRGISRAFPDIPFQMCQFHQVQIVIRYITRRPKLPAGKALKKLILLLTQTDKESFTFWLSEWHRE